MQHLLLLHGAIGAKDQLQSLANALQNEYNIHTINFSGHGGIPIDNAPFSISHFAKDVINYLSQNNIESTNIFGYSMGGYVAMYLAKNHPDKVNKIITLATKFHWDPPTAEKEAKMLNPEVIIGKLPVFAKQLEQRHHPNDWKMILLKTKDMLLELGNKNTLLLTDYKAIQNECLLLLGDKDKMITLDETIAVRQSLPNAEFRLLAGTPHPIEQVDVSLLATIIIGFIKS